MFSPHQKDGIGGVIGIEVAALDKSVDEVSGDASGCVEVLLDGV